MGWGASSGAALPHHPTTPPPKHPTTDERNVRTPRRRRAVVFADTHLLRRPRARPVAREPAPMAPFVLTKTAMRMVFAGVLLMHGALHLMGFAKAYGWAELPQLTQPISRAFGLLWLAAALTMLLSAALVLFLPEAFFVVGGVALVLSQVAIVSSWQDAKYGTLANVLVLCAVALGFATYGPGSLWSGYHEAVKATEATAKVEGAANASLVTEADLIGLPPSVQRYLRVTGTVGKPRVHTFEAVWHGRIRGGTSEPWMPFVAEQVNTTGASSSRLFFLSGTMKRLPVSVFHRFVGEEATFRVRLLSAFTIVDAKGPEMNRSETVTLFNDACLLAPSTLLDPQVRWEPETEARRARAHYTRGVEIVTADLSFDEAGDLVDFVSDDRSAASADGRTFTRMRWSTPVRDFRSFEGRRVPTHGEARWEAPDAAFAYLEIGLVSIAFDRDGSSR